MENWPDRNLPTLFMYKEGEAKDGAAPAADDAAKEGAGAEAPPPAADGDAAGAEGKEDAVEDPMETEDAKQID